MASQGGSRIDGLRLRANRHYSIVVANYALHELPQMTLAFSMEASPLYRVTKVEDTSDGVCDADCSLRDAATAAGGVPGAVLIPAGHYVLGTVLLSTGVGGGLYGAGQEATIIDGGGMTRLLRHLNTSNAPTYALHDLTLANARASGDGGAMYGIHGVYVLDHVTVRDSEATGYGGGVEIDGSSSASIFDTFFEGNTAGLGGGGLYVRGADHFELHSSSLVGNMTTDVTSTTSGGGGLRSTANGEVRLYDSTIAGNHSATTGGGMYAILQPDSSRVLIENLSIVGNTHAGTTTQQAGFVLQGVAATETPIRIFNTVMAGNLDNGGLPADCGIVGPLVLTTGNDFVQAANVCTFAGPGDTTGADPQLQLPVVVGGSQVVVVPMPSSPLIDAGDPTTCTPTDALGSVRPIDGDGDGTATCDIGAIEYVPGMVLDDIFADGFDGAALDNKALSPGA